MIIFIFLKIRKYTNSDLSQLNYTQYRILWDPNLLKVILAHTRNNSKTFQLISNPVFSFRLIIRFVKKYKPRKKINLNIYEYLLRLVDKISLIFTWKNMPHIFRITVMCPRSAIRYHRCSSSNSATVAPPPDRCATYGSGFKPEQRERRWIYDLLGLLFEFIHPLVGFSHPDLILIITSQRSYFLCFSW